MDLKELECEAMDWIKLAKGVVKWQALHTYIHSMDPKLVEATIGYGTSHTTVKAHIQ
jgi:hypothetical protein